MPPYHVLFLCTGNSARSILSEALLDLAGHGRWKGHSAGSHPTGKVHPLAIEQIAQRDPAYPTAALSSKSWNAFGTPDAPPMDVIITVCDNAAGEACPYWPGHPATAHWGYPDPAAATGSEAERRAAFAAVAAHIERRVAALVALPLDTLDANARRTAIARIADIA